MAAHKIYLIAGAALLAAHSASSTQSSPSGVSMRSIMSSVDAATCACTRDSDCDVHVPQAAAAGFVCRGDHKYCCRKKNTAVNVIDQTTDEDGCGCRMMNDCAEENVVYTFGKSCGFGAVRCCPNAGKDKDKTKDKMHHKSSSGSRGPTSSIPSRQALKKQFERHSLPQIHMAKKYSPRGTNSITRRVFTSYSGQNGHLIQVPLVWSQPAKQQSAEQTQTAQNDKTRLQSFVAVPYGTHQVTHTSTRVQPQNQPAMGRPAVQHLRPMFVSSHQQQAFGSQQLPRVTAQSNLQLQKFLSSGVAGAQLTRNQWNQIVQQQQRQGAMMARPAMSSFSQSGMRPTPTRMFPAQDRKEVLAQPPAAENGDKSKPTEEMAKKAKEPPTPVQKESVAPIEVTINANQPPSSIEVEKNHNAVLMRQMELARQQQQQEELQRSQGLVSSIGSFFSEAGRNIGGLLGF